jgi:tight adherence protein C
MTTLLDMPILINVLAFMAIFLFCMGVNQFLRERSARKSVVQKIKRAGSTGLDELMDPMDGDIILKNDGRIAGAVARIGAAVFPVKGEDYSQNSRIRFLRAGYRQTNAPAVYWGIKILLTFLLPAVLLVYRIFFHSTMTYQLTMAMLIFGALFGYYLPDIWLRQKSDKRKEKLLRALPDALDLLVICVEAGIGIDAALQRVSQEIAFTFPELSDEFNYANLELRAGKARSDALRNLAERTNLSEINSLVTLLNQTDKFGTSVANALRVYSETYRSERYQKAEELAAKLPVKLLFPLVCFIFPAMFVILLGPAAISIYKALIVK